MFFSVYGFMSNNFSIPDRLTASRFSLEFEPEYFFELNANYLPMGVHAWYKCDPDFWFKMLHPDLEPMRDFALQEFAKENVKAEIQRKEWFNGMKEMIKEYINKTLDDLERRDQPDRSA
jgi:hypothetical protein